MSVSLRVSTCSGHLVVAVAGELDIATAPELESWLVRHAGLRDRPIIVDLTHVTFMDASGLSALVRANNHALRSRHPRPRLAAPNRRITEILCITGLHTWLSVHPTVAEALRAGHGDADPVEAPIA